MMKEETNGKKVLFTDANGYDCFEQDLIYYVVLSEGGSYRVGWEFSQTIHENTTTWKTLISLSLIKGLFKHKHKAEECCADVNSIKMI